MSLGLAERIDAYRVIPRLCLLGYGALLAQVTYWFMTLPEPSNGQAAFVSTVWGASAAVMTFYINTGRKWG